MRFNWKRAAQYELVETLTPRDAPWLGRTVPALRPIGLEEPFEPFKVTPYLYREFAKINPVRRDEILAFANKYGLLGLPLGSLQLHERDETETIENAQEWWVEVWGISRVVQALDTLYGFPEESWLEERGLVTGSVAQRVGKYAELIRDEVNNARQRHKLIPRLDFQHVGGEVKFQDSLQPVTLIGAIWTQAIDAVLRREDRVPCRWRDCDQWILQSHKKRGPKQQFCSDGCRALFNQQQASKARKMARAGERSEEIERVTRLPPDRIRAIIEEAQKEKRKK